MKTIANVIWLILSGFWSCLAFIFFGVLLCLTIIGIPFGKQCFKIAILILAPFGKRIKSNFGKHPILNLIWFVLLGWWNLISLLFVTLILFICIVTIPFAKQLFKVAEVVAFPFGASV